MKVERSATRGRDIPADWAPSRPVDAKQFPPVASGVENPNNGHVSSSTFFGQYFTNLWPHRGPPTVIYFEIRDHRLDCLSESRRICPWIDIWWTLFGQPGIAEIFLRQRSSGRSRRVDPEKQLFQLLRPYFTNRSSDKRLKYLAKEC